MHCLNNGACYVKEKVNVSKGNEVMIAIICLLHTIEFSEPAQGHADFGVLLGNGYFWQRILALLRGCQANVIGCVKICY